MRAPTGIWLLAALIGLFLAGCQGASSSKIVPPEGSPGGRFGSSVATSGSVAVIGSPGARGAGAVYLFGLDGDARMLEEILPEAATEGDDFGSALDLEGNLMVVGAPLHEHDGYIAGAAFVYRRDAAGSWTEQAILVSDVASDLDYFGSSIAIGSDLIAVGSPGDDEGGSNAGATYIFGQPDLGWSLQEKLRAPDAAPGDRCGSSVSIREDRVLVGCPLGFGSAIQSGAAYLFRLAGSSYVLEYKFSPASNDAGQLFGSAVVLDENRVFIGAPGAGEEYPDGSVHIFDFDGSSWQPNGVLSAGDRVASRGFGAVLSQDGGLLIVGAQRMEGEHLSPGSAYVFGLTEGAWSLQAKLVGNDIDRADGFASSVAVRDGRALVGAAGDAEAGSNAGAAYEFKKTGTEWN